MKVIPKTRRAHYNWYLRDVSTTIDIYVSITITGSIPLLVNYQSSRDIVRPVVSAPVLTWSIRYINYWNLQFQNNVIMIKTQVLLHQV
jgi:hypothetical protein